MRISDWSSDVCSSDLFQIHLLEAVVAHARHHRQRGRQGQWRGKAEYLVAGQRHVAGHPREQRMAVINATPDEKGDDGGGGRARHAVEILVRAGNRRQHIETRSEEHTSELQSLMRISYAVFCLKTKTYKQITIQQKTH